MAAPPPTWSEPIASAVIAAVIVWPGRQGLRLNTAPPTPPAAMATIIVSPRAREKPTIERGDDARDGGRGDDPDARGALPRAQAVATPRAASSGPRTSRPRRSTRSSGVIRMPTASPAPAMLNSGVEPGQIVIDERRAQDRQREEAEHDARDRGQDLEDRLDRSAHARARVLGEEDRRAQAEGRGDEHRDDRDDQRAGDERRDVEVARARLPCSRRTGSPGRPS